MINDKVVCAFCQKKAPNSKRFKNIYGQWFDPLKDTKWFCSESHSWKDRGNECHDEDCREYTDDYFGNYCNKHNPSYRYLCSGVNCSNKMKYPRRFCYDCDK